MKVSALRPVEIDVDAIRLYLPFDADDEIPEDFPGRSPITGRLKGIYTGALDLTVDLQARKIRGWPVGRVKRVYIKVRDSGTYTLLAGSTTIATLAEEYVPNDLIPGEFGDYVDLDILADGTVANFKPTAQAITEAFKLNDQEGGR